MNNNTRWAWAAGITLIAVIGAWLLPPIPQDPAYHDFAAPLRIAGIPNFWNVVSNVPFAVVGIAGLFAVFNRMAAGFGHGPWIGCTRFFSPGFCSPPSVQRTTIGSPRISHWYGTVCR